MIFMSETQTPIAEAFSTPASIPKIPSNIPEPIGTPLICLQYPGPYHIAQSEAMAADAYMQNVIRLACPEAPAKPPPPKLQEIILREAAAQLLHVPYAYGAPDWGCWAMSENGMISLLWILMRIDRPQCTASDAAEILKADPIRVPEVVWERWGLNFTKKNRIASVPTGR